MNRNALPLVSALMLKTSALFVVYLVPCFLYLCAFVDFLFLFKTAPKHRAKMLTGVPKHKKAMIFLMEKTCVYNLPSGMSFSAVLHEFKDNELYISFI